MRGFPQVECRIDEGGIVEDISDRRIGGKGLYDVPHLFQRTAELKINDIQHTLR